jgi:hypothetical protein
MLLADIVFGGVLFGGYELYKARFSPVKLNKQLSVQ